MSDDDLSVTQFATRFRLEAAASLVAVLRDPQASPNARTNAAEKILHWSSRPEASRPITVEDLRACSDEQRMELLRALTSYYIPEGFKQLVADAVSAAIEQMPPSAPPKPVRMIRTNYPALPPPVAQQVEECRHPRYMHLHITSLQMTPPT